MSRRRRARENPLTDTQKILIGSGVVVGVAAAIYFLSRSSSAAMAATTTTNAPAPPLPMTAPTTSPTATIAEGQPGSRSNPLQIIGSLFGPQNAYGVRVVGGQQQFGQFLTPVNIPALGITEYKFVVQSTTPYVSPAQASAASAAAAAQAANAASAAAATAQQQPTPAPAGVTYALLLDGDKSVQLNVGQTLGISFPPSSCGSTWSISSTATGSAAHPTGAPVDTPAWNIIRATAVGTASVTFSCGSTQHTVTVGVNNPGAVVLGP